MQNVAWTVPPLGPSGVAEAALVTSEPAAFTYRALLALVRSDAGMVPLMDVELMSRYVSFCRFAIDAGNVPLICDPCTSCGGGGASAERPAATVPSAPPGCGIL